MIYIYIYIYIMCVYVCVPKTVEQLPAARTRRMLLQRPRAASSQGRAYGVFREA